MNKLSVCLVLVVMVLSAGCITAPDPIVGEWTEIKSKYEHLYPPAIPMHNELWFYENGTAVYRAILDDNNELLISSEISWRASGDEYIINMSPFGDTRAVIVDGVLETRVGDFARST